MKAAGMDLDEDEDLVVVTAVVGAGGNTTASGDSGGEGDRGGTRATKRTRVVEAQDTSL